MKHILATLVALLAFQQAHAQFQAKDLNFAAPIVYGDPLNSNSKIGSITYDLNTNTFRGLYADGNWNTLPHPGVYQTPTVQRFTSGTSTYYTPANVKYIIVEMIGGGTGGSGSSTRAASNGGIGASGVATTFGTSLLIAGGGVAGANSQSGTLGGTPTVNSPAVDIGSYRGGAGSAAENDTVTSTSGGTGGGFGGGPGVATGASIAGATNTGGGGGGAVSPNNGASGSGGGSGALVKALITSPASTYTYAVGTGGAGGGAGTSGSAGGAGGSGIIIVTEYYQ